ncbi:hypothetical protein IAT40_006645 [Kwoniella sp. CBS 6097]
MSESATTAPSIPPLPISLITTLLPHLLPPSPLPQELLSKSLLQRLLYIPPSMDDLDSHLTPFPPSSRKSKSSGQHAIDAHDADDADADAELDQPISTRLKELSHGHRLGQVVYTREGEEEVYAKVDILPEHENADEGKVAIWFEFEAQSEGGPGVGNGRGWVYHSARIPSPSSTADQSTIFYNDVNSLPPPTITMEDASTTTAIDSNVTAGNDGTGTGEVLESGEAPAGYWAAFDSPPPQNYLSLELTTGDMNGHGHHQDEHAEDAYWAQYSRPATAPITPTPMTPGGPLNPNSASHIHAAHSHLGLDSGGSGSGYDSGSSSSNGFEGRNGGNGMTNEKDTARKLAESLRALGLQDNQYNTKPAVVSNGFHGPDHTNGFHFDSDHTYDNRNDHTGGEYDINVNNDLTHDTHQASLSGLASKNAEHSQSGGNVDVRSSRSVSASTSTGTGHHPQETGNQVKDRLRGKIAHALNVIWREYCPSSTSLSSPSSFEIGGESDYGAQPEAEWADPALMEERALSWLRLARSVLEPQSQSQAYVQSGIFPSGIGSGSGREGLDEKVIAKLEVLWEMYGVLQEGHDASDNFYRLVEGVIKRQAVSSHEDEVTRQETYYE